MVEHLKLLKEHHLPVPPTNPDVKIIILHYKKLAA
jgi:hypothetical protein